MRIPGPALLLPLFLAGCALPPAATVASLVVDGLSFVTTGKSTADHAISAFAHEDCALLRVVEGREICDPDGEVLIALIGADAADENWYLDPETGSIDATAAPPWKPADSLQAADTQGQLHQLAAAPIATDMPAPARGAFADAKPAAKPQPLQQSLIPARVINRLTRLAELDEPVATYAVIGSFQNIENARRAAAARGEAAFIQTNVVNGSATYRVLVDQPVEQARNHGFSDAWPVRLCAADLSAPPCGHLVVSKAGVYLEMAEAN